MKIKKLWISKYKNIENLNLEFKSDLISLLVGKNGLGKSNLIEILALIFRDLDLINDLEEFESWAYNPDHFEYIINYECKTSELEIICKENVFNVSRKQIGSSSELVSLDFSDFKKNKSENYLPKYIIGYYSGENKRIRNIIRPYEEKVWSDLKNNLGLEKGLRRMFFAESQHAQLVLLTLLLYKKQTSNVEFHEKAEQLIDGFTSFTELQNFTLELKHPKWYIPANKDHQKAGVNQLEENLIGKNRFEYPFWNAKGKADKILRFFYGYTPSPVYYVDDSKLKDDAKEIKEVLLLESIDKENIETTVNKEFGHPSKFLDAMESLYLIESISKINLEVKSKEKGVVFDFSSLSEGEQQLITVIGLILITGDEDTLFLLDEPDTHLNPNWQREYVNLLHNFNLNDFNSHIILSTHSPLLVQATDARADIFLFKRDEDGKVKADYHDFKILNWRIDQVLESEYFEFKNTRAARLDKFMRIREMLLSKPVLTSVDLSRLRRLETSVGVLPNGETLNDFLAMHLVRSIANQAKSNDQN